MNLHAVVARTDPHANGSARVSTARRAGRIALRRAAELAHAPFAGRDVELPRDAEGAPLPLEGFWWSTANTRGMVAAGLAPGPIGLDVEWLERRRLAHTREYFEETAPDELERVGGTHPTDVLSLWAAKEAVLKRAGVGLSDLGRCPLVLRTGEDTFLFRHRGQEVFVRRTVFGRHVIALAFGEEADFTVVSLPELVLSADDPTE